MSTARYECDILAGRRQSCAEETADATSAHYCYFHADRLQVVMVEFYTV
jgi:hypothetical protein